MARCGCSSSTCSCAIRGGDGVTVDGSGSPTNPYVISVADDLPLTGRLTVQDTDTVDLTLTGSGSATEPWVLTADATLSLGDLTDVDDSNQTAGYVVGRLPDGTFGMVPAATVPAGSVATDATLDGDGSAGAPLSVHEYDRIVFWSETGDIRNTPGSVYLGAPDDDRGHGFVLRRESAAGAPAPHYEGKFSLISGGANGHSAALTLSDDTGATLNRLRMHPSGAIQATGGPVANARPIPYATAAGSRVVNVPANQTSGSATVNLPAGRFPDVPVVVATGHHSYYNVSTSGVTANSFTINVRHIESNAVGGVTQVTVRWFAVYMTPTSAAG